MGNFHWTGFNKAFKLLFNTPIFNITVYIYHKLNGCSNLKIQISRRWSTPYLRRNAMMWRLMCASAYPRRAVRLSRTRLRVRSPRSPATRSQGKSANRFPARSQSTKSTKSVRLLLRRSAPKFQERPAINFIEICNF